MHNKFRYTIILCTILLSAIWVIAKEKQNTATTKGIQWLSVEEAEEKMKTQPKKVYVDLYTDWCGWCKTMDKNTFSHPKVIEYMNTNYYCIRFNAEQKKTITFQGKTYKTSPKSRTHALADEWMNGQISYPTSVFFDEGFTNPQPIPGYLELNDMEMIARYIAENKHKTIPFDTYRKNFKPSWK